MTINNLVINVNKTASMDILPNEILEQIIVYCLPTICYDLKTFYNLRLLNKNIKQIVDSLFIFNQFIKDIDDEEYIVFYNPIFFQNIDTVEGRHRIIIRTTKQLVKDIYGTKMIQHLGGINKFINFPVNYFTKGKCIDKLCGNSCHYKYHKLYKYVNSPVTRGIDDKFRPYILVFYRDTNNIMSYEFLYRPYCICCNQIVCERYLNEYNNLNIYTYSGNSEYIGDNSISYNDTFSVMYRIMNNASYKYLKKLIKYKPLGKTYYPSLNNPT